MSTAGTVQAAIQGEALSYHHAAAMEVFGDDVGVVTCRDFSEVVRLSGEHAPGLGVVAIKHAAGTVERSARTLLHRVPAALPYIVGRADMEVDLALIGLDQDPEDLKNRAVDCLAQDVAWEQCYATSIHGVFPRLAHKRSKDGVLAIKKVIRTGSKDVVAIGPRHAAEPLGAVILKDHMNPGGSITSFYALQRTPERIEPRDGQTSPRTVISLEYPREADALRKCLELADEDGISLARFISLTNGKPIPEGEVTMEISLLELMQDQDDPRVRRWCAQVSKLPANDKTPRLFRPANLGGYFWYRESAMDLNTLIAKHKKLYGSSNDQLELPIKID